MRSGIYCTLISVYPRLSQATYLDSSSETKPKRWDRIKRVLDLAIQVYATKGGKFSKGGERKKDGRNICSHATKFPCVKQPAGSVKEAFYAFHHVRMYMHDSRMEALPANLRVWAEKLSTIDDSDLMEQFWRIQNQICLCIHEDVMTRGGAFHYGGRPLTNREIEDRLELQLDDRTFMTREGCRPLPKKTTG